MLVLVDLKINPTLKKKTAGNNGQSRTDVSALPFDMDHLGSVSEPSAGANAQPAREALAELLQTLVAASEAHACGGQLLPFARACAAPPCLPRIVVGTSEAALPLNLPLTDAQRAMLISSAGRSGVGKSTSTVPVVDLAVRKTWELLPHEFLITNSASWRAGVLDPLLLRIKVL